MLLVRLRIIIVKLFYILIDFSPKLMEACMTMEKTFLRLNAV